MLKGERLLRTVLSPSSCLNPFSQRFNCVTTMQADDVTIEQGCDQTIWTVAFFMYK